MALVGQEFTNHFGTLNNSAPPPNLPDHHLMVADNVERDRSGAVSKRPGRTPFGEVAEYPNNTISPALTNLGASGSSLATGTLYVAFTYSTVAGETDDLFSTKASISVTSGEAVKVMVPFHIKNQTVAIQGSSDNTIVLNDTFNTGALSGFANDTFNGWYLYCRDPAVQDETKLGINPENRKLWDRNNHLALIEDYDASTYTFTLSNSIPFNVVGKKVDILMPDRYGLPVRATNVYVFMSTGNTPYLHGTVTEIGSSTISSVDTSAAKGPTARLNAGNFEYRLPPTVSVSQATDTSPSSGETTTAESGLIGGEYTFRTAFIVPNNSRSQNGSWPDGYISERSQAGDLVLWPSRATVSAVSDGEQASVSATKIYLNIGSSPLPGHAGCAFYAKKNSPNSTLTFSGVTSPSSTHRAYVHTTAQDALLDSSPSAFRAGAATQELATGAVNTAASPVTYYAIGASGDQTNEGGYGDAPGGSTRRKMQVEFKPSAGELSDSSTMCMVVRFKLDKTPSSYSAGSLSDDSNKVEVRRWDNNSSAWVTLKRIGDFSGWKTFRIAHAWSSNMAESSRAVYDVKYSGVNIVFDYLALETYQNKQPVADLTWSASDAPYGGGDSYYPSTTGTYPSSERIVAITQESPVVTQEYSDAHGNTDIYQYVQPSFTLRCVPQLNSSASLVRLNTSNQLPVKLYTANVSDYMSSTGGTVMNMAACGDSVFHHDGTRYVRIYQQEGLDGNADSSTIASCKNEWQFTNFWNRVFFCNPAEPRFNFRYDGKQTHIMGLDPYTPAPNEDKDPTVPEPTEEEPDHNCAAFRVVESWRYDESTKKIIGKNGETLSSILRMNRWIVTDPDDNKHFIYDWRYLSSSEKFSAAAAGRGGLIGTVFESGLIAGAPISDQYTNDIIWCLTNGQITNMDGTGASGGGAEEEDSGSGSGGLIEGEEYDYYYVHKRILDSDGRGYVARSKPRKIDSVTAGESGAVKLTVAQPIDPQVTHIELYRNITGTASYFLIGEIEVSTSNLDSNANFSLVDDKPDESLSVLINFETGRPPASTRLAFHKGRVWMVPQFNSTAVAFTNLNSVSGGYDPEGWYAKNALIPTAQRMSQITALAPYHNYLLVHCDNGIVAISGISDDLDSPDSLRADPLLTDAGALGQSAWCNMENTHFFACRDGFKALVGSEVTDVGKFLGGTLSEWNSKTVAASKMHCAHYRSKGKSQVWFSFSDRTDGRIDRVAMFDVSDDQDQRTWSTWSSMFCNSFVRTEMKDGSEVVLIGDHWGRVYLHDSAGHDAGLFIDVEVLTKPFELAGPARSARPLYVYLEGDCGARDYVNADVYPDFSTNTDNTRRIRISLANQNAQFWNDGATKWNGGGEWPTEGASLYRNKMFHAGRVFKKFQLKFSQKEADMPPGYRKNARFELARYVIATQPLGFRRMG